MTPERKARLLAAIGSRAMRVLIWTLHFRLTDRAGVLDKPPQKPLLWAFWHNRLFVMPYLFERYFPIRLGAALTSASKDGEILAAFVKCFGIRPIRGSSSRGGAKAFVARHAAGDNDGLCADLNGAGFHSPHQFGDDGLLKRGEQIERGARSECQPLVQCRGFAFAEQRFTLLDFGIHFTGFHPSEHRCFESAETEIRGIPFHLRECETDCVGISKRSQFVDHGSAWIAETEELGHFVESLAGSVVARLAKQPVMEALEYLKQMRVATADYKRERGKVNRLATLARLQNHCVNMSFDMIYADQRQAARKA